MKRPNPVCSKVLEAKKEKKNQKIFRKIIFEKKSVATENFFICHFFQNASIPRVVLVVIHPKQVSNWPEE